MKKKEPLWQRLLLVFAVLAAPFLLFFMGFIIWYMWRQFILPVELKAKNRHYIATTYPWSFITINASGRAVQSMDTDGLDDPISPRMYPSAQRGLAVNDFRIEVLHREKSIPKTVKVHWQIAGDASNQTQQLDFPQAPLGSDGYYIFQLGKDGKWTIEFSPELPKSLPIPDDDGTSG